MIMGTEMVVQPHAQVTPMQLLEVAMNQGADLDKLEKLMALQERWEANEARKAYNAAIAQFKTENIKIIKDAAVDFTSSKGRTNYKHATLAGVIAQITEPLCKYGLSHSWRTAQDANKITVAAALERCHDVGNFRGGRLAKSCGVPFGRPLDNLSHHAPRFFSSALTAAG